MTMRFEKSQMYYLFTEQDQRQALAEALRVTKVGGIVCVAYCNNDATIIQFAFQNGMIRDPHYKELIDPVTFKCFSTPEELFQLYRREDIDRLMDGFPSDWKRITKIKKHCCVILLAGLWSFYISSRMLDFRSDFLVNGNTIKNLLEIYS